MSAASGSLARHLEHTLLRPEATAADIARLCAEAREHNLLAVCLAPFRVSQAVRLLAGSPVFCVCVAGFPLGSQTTAAKAREAAEAAAAGAAEIDMVLNVGALKDRDEPEIGRAHV